jgi:hypothetical protein
MATYLYIRSTILDRRDKNLRVEAQRERATFYIRAKARTKYKIEPVFAEVYYEAPDQVRLSLSYRPEGRRLFAKLQPGDHLVLGALEALDHPRDLLGLYRQLRTLQVTLHLAQVRLCLDGKPRSRWWLQAFQLCLRTLHRRKCEGHLQWAADREAKGEPKNQHLRYGYRLAVVDGRPVRVADKEEMWVLQQVLQWRITKPRLSWQRIVWELVEHLRWCPACDLPAYDGPDEAVEACPQCGGAVRQIRRANDEKKVWNTMRVRRAYSIALRRQVQERRKAKKDRED